MKIHLNNNDLDKIDLSGNRPYLRGISKQYFELPSGHESYRLLSYISSLFNQSIIIDLGTSNGASALALSNNLTNYVVSFDIQDRTHTIFNQGDNNLPLYKGNIDYIVTNNFTKYLNLLIQSPLIYLDIAHDGIWEKRLIDLLKENNYKGILIMDDIHDFPELLKIWNEISIPKFDITKYGHYSGFGLVDFSEKIELELS